MESRVRGDLYARFGGEYLETYYCKKWQGAGCLAYGQIASAKIPLSRMISPALYWVMTGDDFSLDINNPAEPKILVVGNNPDRQNIYSAALGLYNSRIVKLINKKGQLKSSVIIDELPTIYFRGLDNLIATARSNKVAVLLGFQDYSQLTRDYGDKESKVIQNTVGNVFSGQVVGDGKDIVGAFREGVAEAAEHDHQPAGEVHLDKHADGQPDTRQQNIKPHARDVRGGCGGQF